MNSPKKILRLFHLAQDESLPWSKVGKDCLDTRTRSLAKDAQQSFERRRRQCWQRRQQQQILQEKGGRRNDAIVEREGKRGDGSILCRPLAQPTLVDDADWRVCFEGLICEGSDCDVDMWDPEEKERAAKYRHSEKMKREWKTNLHCCACWSRELCCVVCTRGCVYAVCSLALVRTCM